MSCRIRIKIHIGVCGEEYTLHYSREKIYYTYLGPLCVCVSPVHVV